MTGITLTPAAPAVEDMVDAHIEFVFSRPHMLGPIHETGIVKKIKQHNNVLWMLVKPDNPERHMRWIPDEDLIRYVSYKPAALVV